MGLLIRVSLVRAQVEEPNSKWLALRRWPFSFWERVYLKN